MSSASFMALDVGTKRIGVAIASVQAKLPRPLTTLLNNSTIWEQLAKILDEENVDCVVIGLPHNLSGNRTEQTRYTEDFIKQFRAKFSLPLQLHDETLSSVRAEEELKLTRSNYTKSDIDALAATLILDEYLRANKETSHVI